MLQQPPAPIVVNVVEQPPITPEIGMGDVVLGAVGITGLIMGLALVAGLLVGVLIIWAKKRREGSDQGESDHARLRI